MASGDRREDTPATVEVKNGILSGDLAQKQPAVMVMAPPSQNQRLRLNPNKDHKPDNYDDMQLDYSPSIFSSLERYLPPSMLAVNKEEKAKFMKEILLKYLPNGERTRVRLSFLICLFRLLKFVDKKKLFALFFKFYFVKNFSVGLINHRSLFKLYL